MSALLAELVRSRRDYARMSQGEVADALARLGVDRSRQVISRIESGNQKNAIPDVFNGLAKVLPVSVDELCGALGLQLESQPISSAEAELLGLMRLLEDPQAQEILLAGARGITRGLLATPSMLGPAAPGATTQLDGA